MASSQLVQKYPSAYYCWIHHPGCEREHYMMFKGIRSRHSTKEEVIGLWKNYYKMCYDVSQMGIMNCIPCNTSDLTHIRKFCVLA